MNNLTIGCLFLTRNTEEVGNDSPGHWNHCAVMSTRMTVVEAQQEPGCVIEVALESFIDRYPEVVAFQSLYYEGMARVADVTIGSKYVRIDSWWNRWHGFNCVSHVDYCYRKAKGCKSPRWQKPDDVYTKAAREWRFLDYKKDYENWVKPASWFEGRLR